MFLDMTHTLSSLHVIILKTNISLIGILFQTNCREYYSIFLSIVIQGSPAFIPDYRDQRPPIENRLPIKNDDFENPNLSIVTIQFYFMSRC